MQVLATSIPGLLRHLFLGAGIPGLVLVGVLGALLSAQNLLRGLSRRTVVQATVGVGVGVAVLGVLGAPGFGSFDAVLVGVVLASVALAVALGGDRLRFEHLLGVGAVAGAVLAATAGLEVDAFGSLRPSLAPLQAVALVLPAVTFLPLGYAARRHRPARWPLSGLVVAAPLLAVAPAVPVGGVGPFFFGVVLSVWATVAGVVGASLFALGWTAAPDDAAPALPADPRGVSRLAADVAVVGGAAVGFSVAALPAAGLLAVPFLPVAVAYLVFAAWVSLRPRATVEGTFSRVVVAVGLGVIALLVRGSVRFGPGYVGQVFRPPVLVLSSVALAVTALAPFGLGFGAGRPGIQRWPVGAVVVGLPVAVVAAATLRSSPWGIALPAVFALVATLLGVPMYRLGRAVARLGGPEPPR